jgi:hypothetical protein
MVQLNMVQLKTKWFDAAEHPSAEEIVPSLVVMIHLLLEGMRPAVAVASAPAHHERPAIKTHKDVRQVPSGSRA